MNRLKSGFNSACNYIKVFRFTFLFLLPGILSFIACENDIEKINSFSENVNQPVQSGYIVEIAYTDSGKLKGKMITPELQKYDSKDGNYIEFPKGIKVLFYDENGKQTSYIRSDYAIYYQKKELWEAKNNVVGVNEAEGKELYTEVLFWEQKSEKIYSDVFSKIVTPDGVFYGEKGFEANQNLNKWKLKESKGIVNVKDEPEN